MSFKRRRITTTAMWAWGHAWLIVALNGNSMRRIRKVWVNTEILQLQSIRSTSHNIGSSWKCTTNVIQKQNYFTQCVLFAFIWVYQISYFNELHLAFTVNDCRASMFHNSALEPTLMALLTAFPAYPNTCKLHDLLKATSKAVNVAIKSGGCGR